MCVCVCVLVVLPPEKAEGCKSFLPSEDGERDALKETCKEKKRISLDVSSQQTTNFYLLINYLWGRLLMIFNFNLIYFTFFMNYIF